MGGACLNLPKERYAMTSNSTVVPLCQSDAIDDPLTVILRRAMLEFG